MNIPNVNPAQGRGRGNDGKRRGFDAHDNGSIRALDCACDAAPRSGATCVVVIHQIF